ncbi:HNH endonuclease [Blastococcus sp. TF02A-30]|uniref:HNH endonuclease n=1 Tax=Blastococcus sp. TF02A-30 TaxID=2250580 RepID=UPI000DE84308|nr:HNH endonuclease [Blastococcus sp. TF02A-30]RBY91046.1 HNH endonuclease [Blastococcus sp. TF02A-30]
MTGAVSEQFIRAAALDWLSSVTLDGTIPVSRAQLRDDFRIGGDRFPLVDAGRGIRRPRGWSAALSILTAAPEGAPSRPYDDSEGPDGLHRYKLRRDQRGASENEGLRRAMLEHAPLMWFYGIRPGLFHAIFPVYLIAEEPDQSQFVMALTEEQRQISPGSRVEETLRKYLVTMTRRRLHQPVFASQVMVAYDTRCAVCSLSHRELLDAAHIIPDSDPEGAAVVTNGLALCKLHHAAYDRNILGIRPDYTVEIHHRLLEEIDGPMLRHGLQEHHGRPLLQIPTRRADRPDTDRLMQRYAQFRAA